MGATGQSAIDELRQGGWPSIEYENMKTVYRKDIAYRAWKFGNYRRHSYQP